MREKHTSRNPKSKMIHWSSNDTCHFILEDKKSVGNNVQWTGTKQTSLRKTDRFPAAGEAGKALFWPHRHLQQTCIACLWPENRRTCSGERSPDHSGAVHWRQRDPLTSSCCGIDQPQTHWTMLSCPRLSCVPAHQQEHFTQASAISHRRTLQPFLLWSGQDGFVSSAIPIVSASVCSILSCLLLHQCCHCLINHCVAHMSYIPPTIRPVQRGHGIFGLKWKCGSM